MTRSPPFRRSAARGGSTGRDGRADRLSEVNRRIEVAINRTNPTRGETLF